MLQLLYNKYLIPTCYEKHTVKITFLLLTVILFTFCSNEEVIDKKIVSTKDSPVAIGPYSQGIVAGGFLFTSGQLPIHPITGEVPATIEEQTKQVLDNLKAIIEAAGSNMENIVKCTVYPLNLFILFIF